MTALRARLAAMEAAHPLAYAVTLVLALDAAVIAVVFSTGVFA